MNAKRDPVVVTRGLWIAGTALLLLLAFTPRVWNIAYGDLSFDEIATVFIANRPLGAVLRYIADAVREHPPLYYLLMALWFRVAGTSEFCARYPAALIGVLGVAWSFRFARRLLRRGGTARTAFEAGIWTAVFLAIMPFSVWAGRTARMYSLVMLLALIIMESWYRWVIQPTRQNWLIFVGASLAGMFTHYYLLFLWSVQGCILLLFPRRTRGIRAAWLGTLAAGISILALGLLLAPGVLNTVRATGSRFPALPLRWWDLRWALMELLLNRSHPELWPATAIGLLLILSGWLLAWKRSRSTMALLLVWGCLPMLMVLLIPEAIHARYMIVALPALAIGLACAATLLRPHWLRLVLALLILGEIGVRWQERLLAPGDSSFSEQVALLHDLAAPGDDLVLNNPWISLLLTYYTPPEKLPIHAVPAAAPPGFIPEEDLPRLQAIAEQHERLWVTYNAVGYSDPKSQVSRWLAENMYNVHQFGELALYLPQPTHITIVAENVSFGPALYLKHAAVDQQQVVQGEVLRAHLEWRGPALSWQTHLALGLLGPDGRIWAINEFDLGPVRQEEFGPLPEDWIERRGLWVRPGVPPGNYQLALKVASADREIITPPGTTVEGWFPLTWIRVQSLLPTSAPDATPPGAARLYLPLVFKQATPLPGDFEESLPVISIPQWAEVRATFGERLALVGLRPASDWVGQGYPLDFSLYWKALAPLPAIRLEARLVGPDTLFTGGKVTPEASFDLGPGFYPVSSWQHGVVIEQPIQLALPRDLPGGLYHVQVRVRDDAGIPWTVAGSRKALTFEEYLHGREHPLEGEWADLFTIQVKERQRSYHPPLFSRRTDLYFGEALHLRGYRLSADSLQPGEAATLTLYWQAQQAPGQVYAAFNHLLSAEGLPIWTQDSWPQGGVYTTDRWLAGEVVAETYTLRIPEDAQPGEYTLHVGLYDPATVIRLPARDGKGQPIVNDAAPLLTVTVMP